MDSVSTRVFKLERFNKALTQLEEVVAIENPSERYVIDSTIKRFEFTFELCWRTLQYFLGEQGIEVYTPKMIFQEAYTYHWLDQEDAWLKMLKDRNMTSHVYHQEIADEIYQNIKIYTPLIRKAYHKIKDLC